MQVALARATEIYKSESTSVHIQINSRLSALWFDLKDEVEAEQSLKSVVKVMNEFKAELDADDNMFYEVNVVEVTMAYMKMQRKDKVEKYIKEIKDRIKQKKLETVSYLECYCKFIELMQMGEGDMENAEKIS